MGTGWRRAFCTTISRDRESSAAPSGVADKQQEHIPGASPSQRNCVKLGFFSGGSNPSTPRLQSQSAAVSVQATSVSDNSVNPKLQCKTAIPTPKCSKQSPRMRLGSNPSSPRSPFSILKKSLSFSRNNCGVCLQSVKSGQGMAIYTAECSHSFHFPCIAAQVRKQSNLVCPVCSSVWKDVPLLAIHKLQNQEEKFELNNNGPKKEEDQTLPSLPSLKIKQEQNQINVKQIDSTRAYDDDEPLMTPTAGTKFIPIPEANEDEEIEDEIEEFQGFFVNPVSSDESFYRDFRNVEVRLMPDAAIVSVGRTHETYAVVLKVKAPPPPPLAPHVNQRSAAHFTDASRRAPIDLVTVLDVSGSMSGAKLQMLKRAMRLVVSSLGSADRLSIVAFSHSAKRLLPLRRMTVHGQRAARRTIDRLACSQGSSVGEALRKAAKVLEDRRERNPVASIMLLSDGQDEQKVQSNNSNQRRGTSHVASTTRFAHIEIPVHSFGFGRKAGYSHEPAEDAFSKCVGGLLSVVIQDLRIQLGFGAGSDPAEITAVYSINGRPTVLGNSSIRLGDLYAEEERELLVELRVPSSNNGTHHVLSTRCCYKDPASQQVTYGREQALLVPRPQAVRSSVPRIERLRNLFIATRAIAESRRLIEHSEMSSAQHLLTSARALMMQSRSTSADEYIRAMEAELAELQWRRQYQLQTEHQRRKMSSVERETAVMLDENGEPLTPTSAWRAAEKLANVAMMKKSLNRMSDLHGFENARF